MSEESRPPLLADVVYGSGGGRDLRCDVYGGEGASLQTAIIFLHGGAFRGGSKQAIAAKLQPYVRLGFTCIAAEYRLTGEAKWPAQIEDVKCCIRWTRANLGELGIDPGRIVVAGYSAGAHLALMAASTMGQSDFEGTGGNASQSSDVAACLAYYPVAELARQADGSAHHLLPDGATDGDHRAVSPLHQLSAASAPTVFFHGTADVTIPPSASERMYAALVGNGVPAELHTFHGVPHEFDRHPEFAAQCAAISALFLDHVLINPRTYPPFAPGVRPATS